MDPTDNIPAYGIFDLFTENYFYNVALWFLAAFYWANIIFFWIEKISPKIWILAVATLVVGIIGHVLYMYEIKLYMFFDSAMTGIPFFFLGYVLRRTPIPYKNKYDKWNFPIAIILYIIVLLLPDVTVDLRENKIDGNILIFYLTGSMMVIALILICKSIKKLPVVSYIGRYSIIVLCTHTLLREPLFLFFGLVCKIPIPEIQWVTYVAIIALMFAVIPLCRKVFPYVTAQKELIPVKN